MESIDLEEPRESVMGMLCTITLVQETSLEASAAGCLGVRTVLITDLITVSSWGGMSLVKVMTYIVTIGLEYSCKSFNLLGITLFLYDLEVEKLNCFFA